MRKSQMIMGALACLIAGMSWGAMFPVADHALEYIDPFYFSFIRYGAVAIVLVLLLLMKEGKKAFRLEGKGKLLVFFGTMAFTVYNVLVFLGQMMMGKPGVMVASIMEALMPMISICILWGYKHIKPKKYMITSMVIAFVGAVFVITKGDMSFFLTLKDNLFSLAFIFIGVVGWVVYTMGGQVFSDWSTLRYSTLTCVFGTAVTGVITMIITMLGYVPVPSAEMLSIVKYDLLFMMTLPGIVALLAWNYGVKILSSINGILFINFVPITTLVIMMMQGYKITTFDIVGTLLVITALIRNNVCQRKEESKNKQVLQEELLRRAV
ncbi:EamA family transporter [Bacillus cereus]|uniref:EamA family transporter n=1 Tax=Bacillus cereus TaxID=1396 RepID=A0A2B0MQQ2_BACCE|nr:EamA family transporter [Bacillus cereus]